MIEQDGLTEEQLALRQNGVGASEAASVLGRSRYGGPIEVWERKTTPPQERISSPNMEWGNLLEPAILTKAERVLGVQFHRKPPTLFSEEFTHLCATPDGVHADMVIDAKALRWERQDEFGPEGTDEIPDDYLIQVTVQMGVYKRKLAKLAVLFGGSDFRLYEVPFSEVLWKSIGTKVEDFWTRYVVARMYPPIDATDGYSSWLNRYFAERKSRTIRRANSIETQWIENLRGVKEAIGKLTESRVLLENNLKQAIGNDYGLESPAGKALWVGGDADGEKVQWKPLAQQLLAIVPETISGPLVNAHTKHAPTQRQLRTSFKSYQPREEEQT